MGNTRIDSSIASLSARLQATNHKLEQGITQWKAKEVRSLFKQDNLASHQEAVLEYLKNNIVEKIVAEINKTKTTSKAMQLWGLLQVFINLNLFATSLARKNYTFNEKAKF